MAMILKEYHIILCMLLCTYMCLSLLNNLNNTPLTIYFLHTRVKLLYASWKLFHVHSSIHNKTEPVQVLGAEIS
jgi:hypothetical protein